MASKIKERSFIIITKIVLTVSKIKQKKILVVECIFNESPHCVTDTCI